MTRCDDFVAPDGVDDIPRIAQNHLPGVCACPACDARAIVDQWKADRFSHLDGLLDTNAPSKAPGESFQFLQIALVVDPNQGMFARGWTLMELVIWLARNPRAIRWATIEPTGCPWGSDACECNDSDPEGVR
mgnify:CR=1 FL=1|tara:strand:+ start:2599 stop:2994 length:396 start_codon:yes stop_codon:yes gene_type:complete